jgi:hypothetical protein
MALLNKQVPGLLHLVSRISALLETWEFNIGDEGFDKDATLDDLADSHHVSWTPNSIPGCYPIAVDFYNADGTSPSDELTVQVWKLAEDATIIGAAGYDWAPEIRQAIKDVLFFCENEGIAYGFEQG